MFTNIANALRLRQRAKNPKPWELVVFLNLVSAFTVLVACLSIFIDLRLVCEVLLTVYCIFYLFLGIPAIVLWVAKGDGALKDVKIESWQALCRLILFAIPMWIILAVPACMIVFMTPFVIITVAFLMGPMYTVLSLFSWANERISEQFFKCFHRV